MGFSERVKGSSLPPKIEDILHNFYFSYVSAIEKNRGDVTPYLPLLDQLLDFIIEQIENPFTFAPYHHRITEPFNYYRFGLDFIRPLILLKSSKVVGLEHVDHIADLLSRKENVILFANHQTEPDPQAISLLLEKTHPQFAEEMIFVAGHRVTTEPLTVPFSKGCNLICIYSKHYVDHPLEQKEEKLRHNRRTMQRLRELLDEGGKCIYVAPSGGRDRPDESGKVEMRHFDPQSVKMFCIIARQGSKTTHFFPLALYTYDLLPPPNSIEKELGEVRQTQCTPVHIAFGPEIDMENFPGHQEKDRIKRREVLSHYVWKLVNKIYQNVREK